jgi:DNA-binding transcriptional ArsR family regulator
MMRRAAEPASLHETLIALADPTRREILRRLSRGDARVTDVAAPFAISLNSVSKHIVMLERAGLVRRRREGREHILSLDPAPIDRAAQWMASQRQLWAARLDALDDALREPAESRAHVRSRKRNASRKG